MLLLARFQVEDWGAVERVEPPHANDVGMAVENLHTRHRNQVRSNGGPRSKQAGQWTLRILFRVDLEGHLFSLALVEPPKDDEPIKVLEAFKGLRPPRIDHQVRLLSRPVGVLRALDVVAHGTNGVHMFRHGDRRRGLIIRFHRAGHYTVRRVVVQTAAEVDASKQAKTASNAAIDPCCMVEADADPTAMATSLLK